MRRSSLVLAALSLVVAAPAFAHWENSPAYASALRASVQRMEEGQHTLAREPLTRALAIDRNEPCGLLTLGALSLHIGNTIMARRAFTHVLENYPTDELAQTGMALVALQERKPDEARKYTATLKVLRLYLRLLGGEAAAVRVATAEVDEKESDPLKLEIAAFAALRGGDPNRGEKLMKALLARRVWTTYAELPAAYLTFESWLPSQAGAPPLAKAISLPEPNGLVLSGVAALTPVNPPVGTTMVTHVVSGAGVNATTNTPPFAVDWNTARVPNGIYTVKTVCLDSYGSQIAEQVRAVRVRNADAAPSHRLDESERETLRARLAELLRPRPCRKAAHFALVERAVARRDSKQAVDNIEAVVAIDPNFKAAYASLKQYHHSYTENAGSVWRGKTNEKIVALTFDDGPKPTTPTLLDALKENNLQGTFFVVGFQAEKRPELLRRMIADGHEIANHSFTHPNLTYLTPAQVQRELCRTSVVIHQATGVRPLFYRPPGGNFNSHVADAAASLGMAGAYWTVDGFKFESYPSTAEKLADFVLNRLKPGAVILLHNAPPITVEAIPLIVAGLKARGYSAVTMSELMKRSVQVKGPNEFGQKTSTKEYDR
ncbi:MAG: polysaccharide deacetylase family protein [Armatimonas sp.]